MATVMDMEKRTKSNSRHRHHRSGHYSRVLRRKKWIIPCVIVAIVAIAGAGFWLYRMHQKQQAYNLKSAAMVNVGSGYRDINYNGKHYRYNNRITTILYAGVDSQDPLGEVVSYTSAPRADSISLIVIDTQNKKMSIIAINRDTMTKIRKFTLNGNDRGFFRDHIGYAYTYGNGGTISCINLAEAVSILLYGIPVDEYMITNTASLSALADIVGPVTVTVPNDDLAGRDAVYAKGAQVVIDSSNLEFFIRARDTDVDLSNVGRMERQKAYIEAAITSLREKTKKNPSGVWSDFEKIDQAMQTSITRNKYLDLLKDMNEVSFEDADYYMPEGEQVVAEDHDEFYPDEEDLLKNVIDIFYIEK